jgi:PBP1b-binding outer membrane lipoprotein LpoB
MVKLKNVILITVIGLAVLFSGCAGTPQPKVSETAQPTSIQATATQSPVTQTPVGPNQVLVTEVKNLPDCIVALGTTQSCSIVNLEIKNNDINSLDASIVKNVIVLSGGKALNKYEKEAGLNSQCVRVTGMEFKVNANSDHNVGICYPSLHKTDNPVLNIGFMLNGDRKDYTFDLTQYGVTN